MNASSIYILPVSVSKTIHKWRLNDAGQRDRGLDADFAEPLDFFRQRAGDRDVDWILAKLGPSGLNLDDFPVSPRDPFAAFEHYIARAIVENRLRESASSTAL